ncbi:MAG: hypothetical protein U1D06_06785 [Paracoccaceae bacterium]|nr:hypothetical protein [Paracoccaceae bacterium]
MDPDILLVVGVVVGAFSIPSMLSAFREGRAPRIAAILVLIAGTLVVLAVTRKPGGYEVADVPGVFLRVIGGLLR